MDQFGVIGEELKKEAMVPLFPEGPLKAGIMTMYGVGRK